MCFEIEAKDLGGRVGRLYTKHGTIKTPLLLPVINIGKIIVKPSKMKEIGFDAIITNAYLVWKKYGEPPPEIHKLLDFSGPIMTDSGAYQILRYGKVEVKPRFIVEYQGLLGSDIGVILDVPTSLNVTWHEAKSTVEETIKRAIESSDIRKKYDDVLWVGPIQGGKYLDLVRYSATIMNKLDFDIYAVGSPTELMENYMFDKVLEMVIQAKARIRSSKPLHLFGAGHPMFMSLAVAIGVDLMDSASYALYAYDKRYLTPHGTYRLNELEELPCTCPACSSADLKELREKTEEEIIKFLSLHNLYTIINELKIIRQAISEGRLWELIERRSRAHPLLYRAYKTMSKYIRFLEKMDPLRPKKLRGLFFYDELSGYRPKVYRHLNRIINRYTIPKETDVLIIMSKPFTKPYRYSLPVKFLYDHLRELGIIDRTSIIIVGGPFIITPLELDEFYPLSQHEGDAFSEKMLKIFLKKFDFGKNVKVYVFISTCKDEKIVIRMLKKLRNKNIIYINLYKIENDEEYLQKLSENIRFLKEQLRYYM